MESKKINQLATNVAPVSTDLTIIGDPITGVSKKITLLQLASIFSGSIAFYTNYAAFPATGTVNTIYCAKDTNKLYLWSGSAYVETFPSQALLDTYQLRSEKGVSNGYASLDAAGKIPVAQLPASVMEYKGMWNASTNTPTLANGTGDTGDIYICNVAGSVNFGAGSISFAVGDYVMYSGTIWQRSSGAVGTVTSVGLSSATSGVTIGSSPITTSGTITLAIANATTSQNGLLTSTDWATFNGKFNLPTLTSGSVLFSNGTTISQNNAKLFWDNTNSRLGINTATPGQALDIHSTANTLVQLNNTTTGDSIISFQNQSVTKWKIGNLYNAGANSFYITNPILTTTPFSISSAGAITLASNVTTTGAQLVQNGFYLSNANAGALAFYTNMSGRDDGINFALRNLTGGAGFIFQSAASYDYTFPAATGTIALTSNIPANIITGTGTSGQVTYFNGTSTVVGSSNHFWDATNNRLGIGTSSPAYKLDIVGSLRAKSSQPQAVFSVDGTTGLFMADGTNASWKSWQIGTSINDGNDLSFTPSTNTSGTPTWGTTKVVFQGNGTVLIGAITNFSSCFVGIAADLSPYNGLVIKNTNSSNSGTFALFSNSAGATAGYIQHTGSTTISYVSSSDYRLKENVNPIQNAIDRVSKINAVTYTWKNTDNEQGEGFIAHELQDIVPLAVSGEKDAINEDGSIKVQGIDYGKLTPLLVKAIQEQQALITSLQDRLIKLESK